MNIKISIGTLLLFLSSICIAQDKFRIDGKFSNVGKDKMVLLNYSNVEGKNITDTAIIKNGKFLFSGQTAFGNKAYISLVPTKKDTSSKRTQPDFQQLYLEKGKYKVSGKDNISNAVITGAQAQKEYLLYNSQMGTLPAQWKQLVTDVQKVMKEKDEDSLKKLQTIGRGLMAKMDSTVDAFIFAHPNSYVSLDLVNENKTSVIDPITFDRYYTALSERVLNSFTGQKITSKYDKARQISIGKSFDFTQEDVEGNIFQLSSLRGKYVLVDFWASWCVPCRAENPNVLKAYETFKDKNFDVVGVSLDDSKKSWLKAVEMDKLPWLQVSDLKGWKNEVAIKYGITAIPQNVLVDPNGIIVGKNLRGEELQTTLASILNP